MGVPDPEKHTKPWSTGYRRLLLLSAGVGLLAGMFVLYRVPPDSQKYFPKCIFHSLTGLHCPGCGTARSLHSLLNGDVLQALAYNLFAIVALPFVTFVAFRKARTLLGGKPPERTVPAWSIWLMLMLIIAFWILRNVEREPFQWLAPHRL